MKRAIHNLAKSKPKDAFNAFVDTDFNTPLPSHGALRDLMVGVKDNIATKKFRTTCASGILRDYSSPYDATCVKHLYQHGARLVGKTNMDEFGMGSQTTHSIHGPTLNPFRPDLGQRRSAGGSSGGSAAAVSAGLVDVALGTDTGGSVRLPASYCGVVGFKPSWGIVSRWGIISYADSLDCVGVLGRDVESVKRVFDVISPYDPHDPTSAPPSVRDDAQRGVKELLEGVMLHPIAGSSSSGTLRYSQIQDADTTKTANATNTRRRPLRVGVPAEYFPAELDDGVVRRFRGVLERLLALNSSSLTSKPSSSTSSRPYLTDSLSCLLQDPDQPMIEIVPISLPNTPYALSAYYVLASAEASSCLARFDGVRYGTYVPPPPGAGVGGSTADVYAHTRTKGFGDEVKKRILLGGYALSADAFDNYFLQAQRVRQLVKEDFDRVFALENSFSDVSRPNLDLNSNSESRLGGEVTSKVDVIMHPSAIRTAPVLDEQQRNDDLSTYVQDVLTVPASLAGLPALSVPMPSLRDLKTSVRCGGPVPVSCRGGGSGDEKEAREHVIEEEEWPMGVSIVGQWGSDELVLEVGRVIERVSRGVGPRHQI